ncbi:MAG: hypothetical protein IT336_09950 [Thermomicrobiales bacterium]|nr:hypothetical protein [Thermomicrobiales bacterium]
MLFAAALSRRGRARDLILLGGQGHVALYLSEFVLDVTRRNLEAKAQQGIPALDEFLEADLFQSVQPTTESVLSVAKIIELKDAAIVAGALAASASYLASYDRKHLLSQAALVEAEFRLNVETPDQIMTRIPDQ